MTLLLKVKEKRPQPTRILTYGRVRKFHPWEQNDSEGILLTDSNTVTLPGMERDYKFHPKAKVFDSNIENAEIFSDVCQDLMNNVERGFDSILFSFGQFGMIICLPLQCIEICYSQVLENLILYSVPPKMIRVLSWNVLLI